ncbi:hypothetical protein [Pseudooceanicola nitratireducens]|uniref:hypothetical protein n=1 Tax=Pseudooceanicola nitratireducens TaxID=517719 RepID=UPI001C984666|nr:hypothetical protein [Pseudooceanicola nitratireducens]MBY6157464.1 hypothetical protein [Pseudooceanicola nitratireducens]
MFQTIDQMTEGKATPVIPRTWAAISDFLREKVSAGASKSSATKTKSAVNGLLKAKGMIADNAPLNLAWFDQVFPANAWDPTTMPFEQKTYQDYRNRVRPLLEEMLGVVEEKKALRAVIDDWDDAASEFERLDIIAGPNCKKKMIPIRNTLTMAARRIDILPAELDQFVLMRIYDAAKKSERKSIRKASERIAYGQQACPDIARRFPHPITPIVADGVFRYAVPAHFNFELEEFVEKGARIRFIRAKKIYEYVADGTRVGMRTSMRAMIDAFIATGHLNPHANSFSACLENPDALADMLGHIVARIGDDGITARHATTIVARLPIIFARNGIDDAVLRGLIKEVEELGHHSKKAGMPERTKQFCRALIERKKFRNNFLLAHATPRVIAQDILDRAASEARSLTREERGQVIRNGTVALFCSIEIGGAPARVENVLEMPFGVDKAWMRLVKKDVKVVIPGAFVKNGEEIRFTMQPGPHRFSETVLWYLANVRPLILTDPDTGQIASSPWLIPMLSDPDRPCPYETFHGWFVRIMRDDVGVPCTPHNYRHGQASLLYHRHPERIGWIAVRLGDTQETVLRYYAWVHTEKAMAEGQQLIADIINS